MTQVSVIIPVLDGEAYVAEAVESALAQAGVTLEVIAIDDGSTDGTPAVLARFGDRISVHRQEWRGLSAGRNAGIARARGELLVFLDADDILPAGFLARFVQAAASAPTADVFHCGWQGIDLSGRVLYGQDSPFDLDRDPFHVMAAEGSPPINALAVRRAAAVRAGPFDENEHDHEDYDWWLRLAASGAVFRGVPGNVAIIRRHENSWSARYAGMQMAAAGLAVLERNLARHERCPACAEADRGLRSWRRAVLRASAADFARRLHLKGRAGGRIGLGLAVARRPGLAPAAWQELRERRRARTARV